MLRFHLPAKFGLLASPGGRISDVKASDGRCVVAVNHDYGICSSFDVLEQLDNKNSAITCAKNHAGKVRRCVKGLIGDFLITIEETVLMSTKVVLGDELVDVQNAIWVFCLILSRC